MKKFVSFKFERTLYKDKFAETSRNWTKPDIPQLNNVDFMSKT